MDVGTWSDLGTIGLTSDGSKSYNAIDPNLLGLNNGTYLMTFGSWWQGLHQLPMDSPVSVRSNTAAKQLSHDPRDDAEEGSYLFYYENYYYFFYSKGYCCGYDAKRPSTGTEYRIMVCRSVSPTGGFVDRSGKSCTGGGGTVVLPSHDWVYGPGGQGVYLDPDLGPVSIHYAPES